MSKIILSLILFMNMSGCATYIGYEGDGTFTDRGSKAAIDRYILDLGQATSSLHEYKLGRLPLNEEYTAGFHVPTSTGRMYEENPDILPEPKITDKAVDDASAEAARKGAVVEIVLKTQSGRIIFHQKAPLADWTWSSSYDWGNAFCYRRMSDDGKSDPGTYFTPKRREQYILQVHILAGEEYFKENEVRILITGGGWMS